MVYLDYVILRQSYDDSLRRLKELLDKKEEVFTKTLPSAIRYDITRVLHSVNTNSALDDYVMDIEAVEQKIRQARVIVYERKEMLDLKEAELRASKDTNDRIFVMRYLDHRKVSEIARKLNYVQETIYKRLNKIDKDTNFYR